MGISDWSSDVCASDLARVTNVFSSDGRKNLVRLRTASGREVVATPEHRHFADFIRPESPQQHFSYLMLKRVVGYRLGTSRSDERRVGKEQVGKCRSRWGTYT